MLDELMILSAIKRGEATLVGPRGTTPQHRAQLFDALSGPEVDHWRQILKAQKHGPLGTYALRVHAQPASLTYTAPKATPSDETLADEALTRYEADARDFTDASRRHSEALVGQFKSLVKQKIKGVVRHA